MAGCLKKEPKHSCSGQVITAKKNKPNITVDRPINTDTRPFTQIQPQEATMEVIPNEVSSIDFKVSVKKL